ncbi:MAG: alkaline phosphatase family protein, partial [Candidatus Ornithospirochaeta sp.]
MERRILLPDYSNSLVNLSSSILRNFGVETLFPTMGSVDKMLEEQPRNVIVLLLDGMGTVQMERYLKKDGPFRSHFAFSYSSVFPSTTVAATTSMLSALPPSSHGWLGWDNYYPPLDKNVTVFLNKDQGTDTDAAPYMCAEKFTPYVSIVERINAGGGEAYVSSPFSHPYPATIDEVLSRILSLSRTGGRKFIYGYWTCPDSILHAEGGGSKGVGECLRYIEKRVAETAAELENSVMFVTADHGHIDTEGVYISEYPELFSLLSRLPSIEPRVPNFFVNEGMEKRFEEVFLNYFGNDYVLMTKDEVIGEKLFGNGEEHPLFRSMLGSYIAAAKGGKTIFFYGHKWKSMHAGLTEDEMTIPLVVF